MFYEKPYFTRKKYLNTDIAHARAADNQKILRNFSISLRMQPAKAYQVKIRAFPELDIQSIIYRST